MRYVLALLVAGGLIALTGCGTIQRYNPANAIQYTAWDTLKTTTNKLTP